MERVPVVSSSLASVGYDADSQTLEVEFVSGAIYQYYGVPESEYEALVNAESKGTYFNSYIKRSFSYSKL